LKFETAKKHKQYVCNNLYGIIYKKMYSSIQVYLSKIFI